MSFDVEHDQLTFSFTIQEFVLSVILPHSVTRVEGFSCNPHTHISLCRSMNKGDLDFSYLTSRMAVMSYPAEGVESAIKNHIDDVKNFLDQRHLNSYAVYNLSNRSYRALKFQNRVWLNSNC